MHARLDVTAVLSLGMAVWAPITPTGGHHEVAVAADAMVLGLGAHCKDLTGRTVLDCKIAATCELLWLMVSGSEAAGGLRRLCFAVDFDISEVGRSKLSRMRSL